MKSKMFQKVAGLVLAGLLASTAQAQGPTFTADQTAAITLAASLYPDLFSGGSAVQTAQGYTYQSFASGVIVGFKDGQLYVSGGPFGSGITHQGTVAAVIGKLTTLKNSVNITPTADMTSLFALAAQAYPTLFAGGGDFQTTADGFLYKYFADSGIYAAIKNGSVFVRGGGFGDVFTSVGALNEMLSALNLKVNGNTGGNEIPSGNFNLVVTGSFSISGPISISQNFPAFTLTGVPAPDVTDMDAIKEAVVAAVSGTGVTITSFNVVEQSANRIEFSVSVSASVQGLSYNYLLNYVYSK